MTMTGPEAALVRERVTPRMGLAAYARLEHLREDPVGVEARSLASVLAGQYAQRLDRRWGAAALGVGAPGARKLDPRRGRWAGFLGMLALRDRRGAGRRATVTVAGLGIADGRRRPAEDRVWAAGASEPAEEAGRRTLMAAVPASVQGRE